jgi:putative DNA primase/helicase
MGMDIHIELTDEQRAAKAARKLTDNLKSSSHTHDFSEKATYSTETSNGAASSQQASSINLHIPSGDFVRYLKDKPPTLVVDSVAASRLAGFMRGTFALNAEAGVWHQFTGTHWQAAHQSLIDEIVTRAMFTACGEVGFKSGYLNSVGTIIRRGNLLPMPEIQQGRLPFQNGLLDLFTRELAPITADNADSWCIPHDYRADGEKPVFDAWLDKATESDIGKQQMLRAFIAAALTGRADLQKFVYMRGPGGTGKSTFMRLLQVILGRGNCVTTDLKNLEQNRFETSRLYGRRLVVITDTDKYGGSVNVLKALTGQDPLRNEQKHIQQNGTFIFGGMVLMAGNETLQATDYTSGLGRRMLVIEFDRVIEPKEKRAFLAAGGEDQLHREVPAIINWALELDRDQVAAFFMHPPESIQKSTFDAATDQNPLLGWITSNLVPKVGAKTYVGAKTEGRTEGGITYYVHQDIKLYPNYLLWCKRTGRECVSLHRFSKLALDVLKHTLGLDVIKHRDGAGTYLQGVVIDESLAPDHWGGDL